MISRSPSPDPLITHFVRPPSGWLSLLLCHASSPVFRRYFCSYCSEGFLSPLIRQAPCCHSPATQTEPAAPGSLSCQRPGCHSSLYPWRLETRNRRKRERQTSAAGEPNRAGMKDPCRYRYFLVVLLAARGVKDPPSSVASTSQVTPT